MIALRLSSGRRAQQLRRRVGHRRAEAVHLLEMLRRVDRDRFVARRRPDRRDCGGCGASFWVSSAVVSHISAGAGAAARTGAQPRSANAQRQRDKPLHATGSAGQIFADIFVVRAA